MRMMNAVSAVVILVLVGIVAGAEEKKAPAPVDWSTTMPAIELSHQPLEKVLGEMKAKLPGFDFSISRENLPHDKPVLPVMTVENVTLNQFAKLLMDQVPGLTINDNYNVGTSGGNFWRVDVKSSAEMPPPAVVRVYGLTDVISYRASLITGDGDHDKQATNDILSLIQQAEEIADDGKNVAAPELLIHAPTKTLIFKGTADQAEIVSSVINVLQPPHDQLVAQLQAEVARLQGTVLPSAPAATTKPSK